MSENSNLVEVVATRPGFNSAKGEFVEKGQTTLVTEAMAANADKAAKGGNPTWFKRLRNAAGEVVVDVEELIEKTEGFVEATLSELGSEMAKSTKGKGWKA